MSHTAALEAAARARVTMVVGASDVGKTTLTTAGAGALAARGERVAVVDADLGQSELGPPTTIGLARVAGPLAGLRDAELLALEFVGTTSPAHAVTAAARATAGLVEQARRAGFDRILVDTSGLVAGAVGRWLKRTKVELVRPDLVVVIARGDESDAIAADASGQPGVQVLRVAAAGARRRSPDERRRHRARALAAYFAGAAVVRVPLRTVAVRRTHPPGDARPPGVEDVDLLVGLADDAGATRGIGRLLSVDAAARALTIVTPVARDAIATVTLGRERYEEG